jgi:type II secretory pathway component PulM
MIQVTRRERLLAIGLTAAIAVWAVYGLAVKPTRDRIRTLERIIPEKQVELRELQASSAEYMALQNEFRTLREKMASQESDFQLLPFLEGMIERCKLAGNIVTMQQDMVRPQPNYSEVVVTIELQDISLRQLVDFLAAVENSETLIQVGSLHIRKDPTNELLLDSTVGIYSPQPTRRTAQLAQD